MNPDRSLVTGTVYDVRVQDVPDALMKEIRALNQIIDELVKGKEMEKVLRVG